MERRLRRAAMLIVGALLLLPFSPLQATAATPLVVLSEGRPATASSVQSLGTVPFMAVDGLPDTRWGSDYGGADPDDQWFRVDLVRPAEISRVEIDWETAYARSYTVEVSDDAASWTPVWSTTTGAGGTEATDLGPVTARYVRLHLTERGTGWGYSLYELRVLGTAPTSADPCADADAALGRPASASGQEGSLAAGLATDGDPTTRWGSAFAEPQWWQVDLGARRTVCAIDLHWEAAFGATVQVLGSRDATTWTELTTVSEAWGAQRIELTGEARHLRLVLSGRSTIYGFSLWAVEVHTTDGDGPTPLPAIAETTTGVATAVQHALLVLPADAVATLPDAGSDPDAVEVAGQGVYRLTDGVVSFTPVLGFAGTATSLRVHVVDSWDQTEDGTVTAVVAAPTPPAAPVATSVGTGTEVQHASVEIPDHAVLALGAVDLAGIGAVDLDASSGDLTFQPVAGFSGAVSIPLLLTDAYAQTVTGVYRVTVRPGAVVTAAGSEAAETSPTGLSATGADPQPILFLAVLLVTLGGVASVAAAWARRPVRVLRATDRTPRRRPGRG